MNIAPARLALVLCTAASTLTAATNATAADREPAGPPLLGKYGCSESVYTPDGFTPTPRGFVSLLSGHRYRQGKGKIGKYSYAAKSGKTKFKGGGLGGSSATAIDGKRNRLFITVKFSDGKTAHWACTRVGKA